MWKRLRKIPLAFGHVFVSHAGLAGWLGYFHESLFLGLEMRTGTGTQFDPPRREVPTVRLIRYEFVNKLEPTIGLEPTTSKR